MGLNKLKDRQQAEMMAAQLGASGVKELNTGDAAYAGEAIGFKVGSGAAVVASWDSLGESSDDDGSIADFPVAASDVMLAPMKNISITGTGGKILIYLA